MRKNGADRPQQPLRRKLGWLTAFVGLTLLLLTSMSIQLKTLQPWLEDQKAKEQQLPPPQVS